MMSFKSALRTGRTWLSRPLPEKVFRRRLAECFLLALVLRVVLALPALAAPETLLRPDSASFLEPARALACGDWFRAAPGSEEWSLLRPPGYPLFLAPAMKLGGGALLAAALAGCIWSASAVWPVAWAVRRVAGERAGVLGALCWGLALTALAQAPQILSDSMMGVLAAWQCYMVVRVTASGAGRDFALLSLLAAAGCYIKPVNLPVAVIGLPVLALAAADSARRFVRFLGIAAGVCAVLLVPYWVFMARRTGGFDGNTANIVFHNGAAVMARVTGESSDVWRDRLLAEAEQAFAREPRRYRTLLEQNRWKMARFRKMIREYPKEFLIAHLPNPGNLLPDLPGLLENNRVTVSGGGTLAILRRKGLWAAADHYLSGRWGWLLAALPLLAVTGMIYLGAVWRLAVWCRARRWRLLLVFGVLVFYYIWAPGPVISPRYALPALPFLIVMALWSPEASSLRAAAESVPPEKETI